jgi:lysophospholipase L1-like esterase
MLNRNNNFARATGGRWFLAVFSLGLALGAGELFCRLLNLGTNIIYERNLYRPAQDSDLCYELTPGYRGHSYGGPVTVSAQGFRNAEVSAEPAPGVYRIVCVGDSMTFGMGVDDDVAWPQFLARELSPPPGFSRVEVVNTGVCGYDLEEYCAVIGLKALALHPALILIGLVDNDLDPPFHVEDGYLCAPRKKTALPIPGKRWFQTHSALYQFLSFKYSSLVEGRIRTAHHKKMYPVNFLPATITKVEQDLRQTLAKVADAHVEIEGVLLNLSDDSPIPALCERAGLRCFKANLAPQNRLMDGHPNPEGHRLFAQQIKKNLTQE